MRGRINIYRPGVSEPITVESTEEEYDKLDDWFRCDDSPYYRMEYEMLGYRCRLSVDRYAVVAIDFREA